MIDPHSILPATGATTPQPAEKPESGLRFSDVLSALNPLQYLPVVGTIYRAVTGDTIPEALRIGGSLGVGFLFGGPIGLAIGAASALGQKLCGLDLDEVAHTAMVDIGVLQDTQPAASGFAAAPAPVPVSTALAAYGQALRGANGMLGPI
jgi:hypothetical protein